MFNSSEKLPLGRALLWIFLSTLLTSGMILMSWLYYLHQKELRLNDSQYRIVAIVQACPQAEALKTVYLAEWLNLSLDKPINLYLFDLKKAEERLLDSPLIKQAAVKRIRPGILYIEYHMRAPIAYLGDYTNTALDIDGYLFPSSPFFTPKKLPILYLGLDHLKKVWGSCLMEDERLQLAFKVLRKMNEKALNVKQVDVSQAFADSYGQRQIIITLEEGQSFSVFQPYILRLNTEQYEQNLANFTVLKDYLVQNEKKISPSNSSPNSKIRLKPLIIDFRIPHLAFIKKESYPISIK